MKENTRKVVWEVGYRNGEGENDALEVIARNYEELNEWIVKHTWCNTVFHVKKIKTLEEIGA